MAVKRKIWEVTEDGSVWHWFSCADIPSVISCMAGQEWISEESTELTILEVNPARQLTVHDEGAGEKITHPAAKWAEIVVGYLGSSEW